MKNKLVRALVLTSIFTGSMSIRANALSLDNLDQLDYNQQNTIVNREIKKNESDISNIEKLLKDTDVEIGETKKDIITIEKEKNTEEAVKMYKMNSLFQDKLQMLNFVLSSDSVSDFFQNINIAKKVIGNSNDNNIDKLTECENNLVLKYKDLCTKKEDLTKNKEVELKEREDLTKLSSNLKQLTGRKKGNLSFNPNNILEISNLSVEDATLILDGTALKELAPVYIEAENRFGVNAVFLMALSAHESAWGTSNRAINDNNLTGFGVYSDGSIGINSNTKRGNLLLTAKTLKDNYLSPTGQYFYNGYGIQNINHYYCLDKSGNPDMNWSKSITDIGNGLMNKLS